MDGDVDTFLREVRTSEKLLQELQEHLQNLTESNEKLQADVSDLSKEHQSILEDGLRSEQELVRTCSLAAVQSVRLQKIQSYKSQVKNDLRGAESELSSTRNELRKEIDDMCSEIKQHLTKFGLRGNYAAEIKEEKASQIAKTQAQTERLSVEIMELKKHQSVLLLERKKLLDVEAELKAKAQSLSEPSQSRLRLCELQQQLCRLEHEQKSGEHLRQLRKDVADVEEETSCIRSAVAAMAAELQKLEQLLWFSRMERMKKRMQAKTCGGSYHCGGAEEDGQGTPVIKDQSIAGFQRGGFQAGKRPNAAGDGGNGGGVEDDDADFILSDEEGDGFVQPKPWSGRQPQEGCATSKSFTAGSGARGPGPSPPPSEAVSSASASPAAAAPTGAFFPGGDASRGTTSTPAAAAALAQRRWEARRARMMVRRPPAPPPPAAASPAPAPRTPLASVRPLRRPAPAAAPAAPAGGGQQQREWGRAAAPGRLSYRGPQPAKRGGEFRSALQQLHEQAAAAPQKRVRFQTDAPPEEQWEEMEDFM